MRHTFLLLVISYLGCDQGLPTTQSDSGADVNSTVDATQDSPTSDASNADACPCGNACANFATDPANCGACNHDCLGGSCTSGQCQPISLASGIPGGYNIALDTATVYFGTLQSSIMSVPKNADGGSATLLFSGSGVDGIAVDSNRIYFANTAGEVQTIPLDGGTPSNGYTSISPQGVAVDSTYIYWTTYDGHINRAPIPNGGNIDVLASGQADPLRIAVDANFIYWTNYSASTGAVMKLPLGGGTPAPLATGQLNPYGIALDTATVYWTNSFGGTVMSVPKAGGTPTTLASNQTGPTGIAVDNVNVYWATTTAIMRVPIGGGVPIALASNQPNPYGVAVDDKCVYWTTEKTGGDIMRLAK